MKLFKYLIGFLIVCLILALYIIDFNFKNFSISIFIIAMLYTGALILIYLADNYLGCFLKKVTSHKKRGYINILSFILLVVYVIVLQKMFAYFFKDEILPDYFLYCFPIIFVLNNIGVFKTNRNKINIE